MKLDNTTQYAVLGSEDAIALGRRVLSYTSGHRSAIEIVHTARSTTHVSRNQVRSGQSGDTVELTLMTAAGKFGAIALQFNQLDDITLKAAVEQLEHMACQNAPTSLDFRPSEFASLYSPKVYLPVRLWHDETLSAVGARRIQVLPEMVAMLRDAKLMGSVFIGTMARTTLVMFKDGLEAVGRETDSEITVTAWNEDGKGSGWAGGASRNWTMLDSLDITRQAIELTTRSHNPQGLEPGRYAAILGPEAAVQFVAVMGYALNARFTDMGSLPFSRPGGMNRLGQQVVDERITLSSNPTDPDGGYLPFMTGVSHLGANSLATPGLPLSAQTWINKGRLVNLAYDPAYAAARGKAPYNSTGGSLRLSGVGPHMTLEEMIQSCERGIYVNRFSGVQVIDRPSGMTSGVTRDGCFFIRNGKIDRPIKNFRFLESPFHALNRLEAIGTTARRAFGYTPGARSWPLPPVMVPPLMIRDFNFAALAEAV